MSAVCRAPHRSNRSRAALLTVGAAVSALALAGCGSGGTSGGSSSTKFITGTGGIATVKKADRQAAPDIDGTTLNGDKLGLSDYKGKVVVVNVWGSWCSPCRAEAPYLAKVAKQTESKGVQFVGLNTRDPEKGPARQFEKQFKVDYPSLYDPAGKLMLRFPKGSLNPQAIPSTIVIDRQGKIAARSLSPLDDVKMRKMIDPLIAEK
ncbi:TlpA family protein disulfide reductase [Streptomyces tsukubensis]|uniref:Redoxin domain-containing protein n=1 Tax=Streptomyces tsukubensis TaxID=83656 RepID=A0A1V4A865_9ACTN|nr:TlpA disulfide reductase family protein [Streptomyces tsukubensis]OON78375.1 redoxin domain-containing protein [Streptomyces tsukubensis]QFR95138.1 redoxin family protein [Streptomyces tsukubensis]